GEDVDHGDQHGMAAPAQERGIELTTSSSRTSPRAWRELSALRWANVVAGHGIVSWSRLASFAGGLLPSRCLRAKLLTCGDCGSETPLDIPTHASRGSCGGFMPL